MKKMLFAAMLLSISSLLLGQQTEKKKFEFGLIFTGKIDYLKPEFTDWNELGISNELNQVNTKNRLGFGLGLLYKFNVTDHFAIVPQTILTFQQSQLQYDFVGVTLSAPDNLS